MSIDPLATAATSPAPRRVPASAERAVNGAPRPIEPASAPDGAAARTRVLDDFFDSYFRLRPVNATYTGDHRFDHLLPDWSPEGLSSARAEMSDLRRALAAGGLGVLDDESLRARDWTAIDGALADAFLEIELAELGAGHFQRGNLSLAVGEALFGLISLMTGRFAGIEHRGHAAASRLKAFPLFLVGVRRQLEEVAIPDAWRERVLRECGGGQLLLDEVEHWLDAEGAPESIRADARVGVVVARESLNWFATFVKGLRTAPVTRYAAGSPLFELLLRRGHWIDGTAESLRWEAHEILEEEYQRLYVALRRAGLNDWSDAQELLAAQAPAASALPTLLRETWDACRQLATERDLVTWPEMPIHFAPAPEWVRAAAPHLYYLLYRSPSPLDDESVALYTIPAADPRDGDLPPAARHLWNPTAIRLNHIVHHGAIGHQLQNWHARRAPSRIGRVAAVDCANRIGMFSGGTMAEGWACYATDLMEEHGFLSPLDSVAQQHTRVRLLTRAVVDLELHGGRMSFDDAVETYMRRTGMSPAAARAETTKNSMFPGTAVMYWLGTRDLRRLRAGRQRASGSAFSLRAFHDELLSFGSLPVTLVGRLLTRDEGRGLTRDEGRAPSADGG